VDVRRSRVGQWLVTAVVAVTCSLGSSAAVLVTPAAGSPPGGHAAEARRTARAEDHGGRSRRHSHAAARGGAGVLSARRVVSPAQSFVVQPTGLPPAGEASISGCAAALTYLYAYAAPGFVFRCPAAADGHQAATMCVTTSSPCDSERLIEIGDPCPAAYMNEASNSWVLLGVSDVPIDPYGQCP